jgi:SAM-dependent methyltransferase
MAGFAMTGGVLEFAPVYRLWQAPFAERKLRPLFRHNDVAQARRVLDVACGPGTSSAHFAGCDYLGIDINPRYIEYARRRYRGRFEVADATQFSPPDGKFDLVLVNSFFHHVSDADAERLLDQLATLVAPGGHVHIFDLVLPPRPSVARLLARMDRGDFARPLESWRELFTRHFTPVVFEPYPLGMAGLTLWNMVYFKGAAR